MRLPLFNFCGPELEQLGISRLDVLTAYQEFYGAFGEDWVTSEFLKMETSTSLLGGHPLCAALGTGATAHVLGLLELVVALRRFRKDPAIPDLLATLKSSDHYENTFYTLSIGLRLDLLGLNPILEPPTTRGSFADLAATLDGRALLIECTNGLRGPTPRSNLDLLNTALKKIPLRRYSVVEIDFLSFPLPSARNLTGWLRQAVRRFESGGPSVMAGRTCIIRLRPMGDGEIAQILEGQPLKDVFPGAYQARILNSAVPGRPDLLGAIDLEKQELETVVLCKFQGTKEAADATVEDCVDAQVHDKLRQIRRHPANAISILFVNPPRQEQALAFDGERIQARLNGDAFQRAPNLCTVVVTQRVQGRFGRQHYVAGYFPNPGAASTNFSSLLTGPWCHLENNFDIARFLK